LFHRYFLHSVGIKSPIYISARPGEDSGLQLVKCTKPYCSVPSRSTCRTHELF